MGGQFAALGSTQLLDHFYQTVSSPSTQLSFLVISIKLFGDISPEQLRKERLGVRLRLAGDRRGSVCSTQLLDNFDQTDPPPLERLSSAILALNN